MWVCIQKSVCKYHLHLIQFNIGTSICLIGSRGPYAKPKISMVTQVYSTRVAENQFAGHYCIAEILNSYMGYWDKSTYKHLRDKSYKHLRDKSYKNSKDKSYKIIN